jgi:hypothetical protein
MGVDTDEYHRSLLKGLKGKGVEQYRWVLRRDLRAMAQALTEVEQAMEQLVNQFDDAYRPPRLVQLRIRRKKTSQALYWRLTGIGGDQPFLRLFQTRTGLDLLSLLPPQMGEVLQGYELQRLSLNWRYTHLARSIQAMQVFVDNLEQLHALQPKG